ncbi:hypothetical protein G7062_03300 [Erysipelothrix sp. HDW6C]|uniref:hypothetical protein n=1 Tax=Erysipelothrix sp. HDW6C TaxID=2714930 RepID=UPI00140BBE14|nr:hypothetical protein [Erysipelothrix sp. HDW6C]QIK69380.1 hypothetical protein G7062_03300 [Erysipelothrix sp. HDW6C]
MVGKLIKNEIKENVSLYTPVFIMTLIGGVASILLGMRFRSMSSSSFNGGELFIGLAIMIIYTLLIASAVMTIRAMIIMLYHSLYKKNAYRVFTYPVSSTELLVSKVIGVTFWTIVSSLFIVGIYVGALLLTFNDFNIIGAFVEIFSELRFILFESDSLMSSIILIANYVFSSFATISYILLAGSIANSKYIRRGRGLYTFLIYFGITIVVSVIGNMIAPTTISSYSMSRGFITDASLMLSLLRHVLFATLSCVGTIWMWNNKLEILN